MPTARLRVRVNPRSSRNQVTGWQDGVLSVKLTAPPVEGAANKACIDFLADLLGLRKSQLSLESGPTSRDKVFQVDGLSDEDLAERLAGVER